MTIFLDILSYTVCGKITFALLQNTYLVITDVFKNVVTVSFITPSASQNLSQNLQL